MKPLRWSLAILAMLTGTLVQAQSQEFTLDELLSKALTHNLGIQAQQLETSITEARISEVKANALPQVSLSGDYKYYIKIPAQVLPLSAFGGPEGQYTSAAFGLPWNLGTTVQASQVLYNHSLHIGLKAAKLGRDITALQIRRTKEDVSYNVSAAYYNAQTVAQQIQFLRGNMEALDRSIRITDLRFQNKLAQGIDVDRLRLNRTSLETQVESLQADYNQLLNLLKFLAGIPQQEAIRIQTTIEPAASALELAGEPSINRTELLLIDRQKEANLLEQKNIKAEFVPSLAAYGVANHTTFAIGGDQSYTKGIPAYWAGIQLNWNIFDGFARRTKLNQKQIAAQQLTIQEQQTRESIAMDIANSRNKIAVQQRNLKTSQEQIELAQKVYTQSQLQFKEGTTDITNLIQTVPRISGSKW